MQIKEIDLSTIEHIWRTYPWSNRTSVIEPYSAMTFMDSGYDASFADKPSTFFGGYIGDKLIAVTSVHMAETYMARHRGLWVDPNYRNNGYATLIIKAALEKAATFGAHAVWSFPRKASMPAHIRASFTQVSRWVSVGEFGPNCYALAVL